MSRWIVSVVLVGALLVGGLYVMPYVLTQSADSSSHAQSVPAEDDSQAEPVAAAAPGPAQPAPAERPFDAGRSMTYLKDLCKIGTRISGSAGMKKQQELLKKHFEALGGKVEMQEFTAVQNSRPNQQVAMANMIVKWHPERTRRVILCSHYDTRPKADEEKDPRKQEQPFLSANDGGSGVALLMELAHHMKNLPTEVGVDFVFFDGEEYIFDRDHDKYFFGSEHFASAYQQNRSKYIYLGAILFDMIGGKNAQFPVEPNSAILAGKLVVDVWMIAADQKCAAFRNTYGRDVLDDHLALNAGGIPAIDIIDFDYPHWHKLSDTPENCSGESLQQVARVVTVWLQRVK